MVLFLHNKKPPQLVTNCFINECLLSLSTPTGTVGIEPTHIIRPSTIQLSRRYLYRFPITVHVPTV
ncbi:TPA: hypothetical protein ACHRTA_001154 [Streptococcus agalactiae]